jgi:hypothetical protein
MSAKGQKQIRGFKVLEYLCATIARQAVVPKALVWARDGCLVLVVTMAESQCSHREHGESSRIHFDVENDRH